MTKTCTISFYYKDEKTHQLESDSFTFSIDENQYINTSVPPAIRKSTYDAVKFHEVMEWCALQLALGTTLNTDIEKKIGNYLKYSFAFRAYQHNNTQSYDEKYFTDPILQHYFNKLDINHHTNQQHPENYLRVNYQNTLASEPLNHVRECEDIGCSFNPNHSGFIKLMGENVKNKIIEHANHTPKYNKHSIIYCGFAPGLLRRDLSVIQGLIYKANIKEMEFIFVDKAYQILIEAMLTCDDLSDIRHYTEVNFLYKSITEFTAWVTSHLHNNNKTVNFHFFSDAHDAVDYLQTSNKKITLLVAQDYFTENGCRSQRYATPTAHEDFMYLAKNGLSKSGRFFEIIKDDNKNVIYLHIAEIIKQQYQAVSTKEICTQKRESRIYDRTPLTFFTNTDRSSLCDQEAHYTEYKYDIDGNLLSSLTM